MKIKQITPITRGDFKNLCDTSLGDKATRQLRGPLLRAFDIYKSNIAYGVISEGAEEHQDIVMWYRALLEKEEWAIDSIPQGILPYLEGV